MDDLNENSRLINESNHQKKDSQCPRLRFLFSTVTMLSSVAILGLVVAIFLKKQLLIDSPNGFAGVVDVSKCFTLAFNGGGPAYYVNRCSVPVSGLLKVDGTLVYSTHSTNGFAPYSVTRTEGLVNASEASVAAGYISVGYSPGFGLSAATQKIEGDLSFCIDVLEAKQGKSRSFNVVNSCSIPRSEAVGIDVVIAYPDLSGQLQLFNLTLGWVNNVSSNCGYGVVVPVYPYSQVLLATPRVNC